MAGSIYINELGLRDGYRWEVFSESFPSIYSGDILTGKIFLNVTTAQNNVSIKYFTGQQSYDNEVEILGTYEGSTFNVSGLDLTSFSYDINECRILSRSGTYTLQNNLVNYFSCLISNRDNVIINCDNYNISFPNSISFSESTGIFLSGNNLVIDSCNFEKKGSKYIIISNSSNVNLTNLNYENSSSLIYLDNVNNIKIENITSDVSSELGISISNGENVEINNISFYNMLTGSGLRNLNINNVTNLEIKNSIFDTIGGHYAIHIVDTSRNIVISDNYLDNFSGTRIFGGSNWTDLNISFLRNTYLFGSAPSNECYDLPLNITCNSFISPEIILTGVQSNYIFPNFGLISLSILLGSLFVFFK